MQAILTRVESATNARRIGAVASEHRLNDDTYCGAMVAPDNPILARLWRGDAVESIHRGVWVVADIDGHVAASGGDPDQLIYARSSLKSIQALAFVESGAADAIGAGTAELAIAISSHDGEPIHLDAARRILQLAGLDESALQCGPARPKAAGQDHALAAIANNCSGKHAAFLATALHLGDAPARYLDAGSAVQRHVHAAVADLSGAGAELSTAIDGCSAPTFRLPIRSLATALARMANPDSLDPLRCAACARITDAAACHPDLVAGSTGRVDTELLRAAQGRWFAKSGAEGVQCVGVVGVGIAVAVKIDDGSARAAAPVAMALLDAFAGLDGASPGLDQWRAGPRSNSAGVEVGRLEVCLDVAG